MTAPNLDKYKAPYSFAINRTQKSRLEETLSTKDMGSKSDGVSDDTAVINAGLAVLATLGYGVVVTVPSRTVFNENLLNIPNNVTIEDRSRFGKIRYLHRGLAGDATSGGIVLKASGVSGVLLKALDAGVPAAPYVQIVNENTAGLAGIRYSFSRQTSYSDFDETTAPAAPGVGVARLFARSSGGKTELCVRFNSGAVQVLAVQP